MTKALTGNSQCLAKGIALTVEARREYLNARRQRGLILDEFCEVCRYNRKHAIRILGKEARERAAKPGPRPRWDIAQALKKLGKKASDYLDDKVG